MIEIITGVIKSLLQWVHLITHCVYYEFNVISFKVTNFNQLDQCFPRCAPVHSNVHRNYFTVHTNFD